MTAVTPTIHDGATRATKGKTCAKNQEKNSADQPTEHLCPTGIRSQAGPSLLLTHLPGSFVPSSARRHPSAESYATSYAILATFTITPRHDRYPGNNTGPSASTREWRQLDTPTPRFGTTRQYVVGGQPRMLGSRVMRVRPSHSAASDERGPPMHCESAVGRVSEVILSGLRATDWLSLVRARTGCR